MLVVFCPESQGFPTVRTFHGNLCRSVRHFHEACSGIQHGDIRVGGRMLQVCLRKRATEYKEIAEVFVEPSLNGIPHCLPHVSYNYGAAYQSEQQVK